MSSANVTTLCRYGCWQCEARFVGGGWTPGDGAAGTACPQHYSDSCLLNGTRACFSTALDAWSAVWDLRRSVLLLKYEAHNASPLKLALQEGSTDFIAKAPLPSKMRAAGVSSLRLNVIEMWRPSCLANISHHRYNLHNKEVVLINETEKHESQAKSYRGLRSAGVNVLLLSYADVLWRTPAVLQRLRSFLPGGTLAGIRADFQPILGRDFFPGNKWKVDGTIESYAKAHPPSRFGYDVQRRECKATSTSQALRDSHAGSQEAEAFLRAESA